MSCACLGPPGNCPCLRRGRGEPMMVTWSRVPDPYSWADDWERQLGNTDRKPPQTPENEVEEVARAICKSAQGYECYAAQFVPYKGEPTGPVTCGCGYWDKHSKAARAAIVAIRASPAGKKEP